MMGGAVEKGGVAAWLFRGRLKNLLLPGFGQKSCAQLYSGSGGKNRHFAKFF